MDPLADKKLFKRRQMEVIARHNKLTCAADLETFLKADPKTKDNQTLQEQWKAWLQDAVPALRT